MTRVFVRDARVAQIVADADTDFAPRRIPDFLFRRGQAVVEKLDRHALGLFENNLAVRADDKGGVVINIVRDKIFAADDEKARVVAAPVFQRIGHAAVERVFAQNENGRVGVFGEGLVQDLGNDGLRWEFHLDADE